MIDHQAASLLAQTDQTIGAVMPPSCSEPQGTAGAYRLEAFDRRTPPVRPASSAAEQLDLRLELGHTRIRPGEARQLRSGSVVTLDKLAGEPVDLCVGSRRVARGELLVLEGKIAVRIVELAGN
ncbi:MAG: FliM/FliN family flagellar motor switch protein [Thermoguttaceae bacterium]